MYAKLELLPHQNAECFLSGLEENVVSVYVISFKQSS